MHRLTYTHHVRARMRQRRVTRRMLELTLADPDEPYRRGRIGDEEIAERRFARKIVQVIFEERKTGDVVLITVKIQLVRKGAQE